MFWNKRKSGLIITALGIGIIFAAIIPSSVILFIFGLILIIMGFCMDKPRPF